MKTTTIITIIVSAAVAGSMASLWYNRGTSTATTLNAIDGAATTDEQSHVKSTSLSRLNGKRTLDEIDQQSDAHEQAQSKRQIVLSNPEILEAVRRTQLTINALHNQATDMLESGKNRAFYARQTYAIARLELALAKMRKGQYRPISPTPADEIRKQGDPDFVLLATGAYRKGKPVSAKVVITGKDSLLISGERQSAMAESSGMRRGTIEKFNSYPRHKRIALVVASESASKELRSMRMPPSSAGQKARKDYFRAVKQLRSKIIPAYIVIDRKTYFATMSKSLGRIIR